MAVFYGCFLVWWFIELIGCDVDVLASCPLILFSSSYRPHWVLCPLWGLGRVELYNVAHSKFVWRVQLDGITRHVRFCQKFWTEAKFLTHQKFSQQFFCVWSRSEWPLLNLRWRNTQSRVWIRLSVLTCVHVLCLLCVYIYCSGFVLCEESYLKVKKKTLFQSYEVELTRSSDLCLLKNTFSL